MKLDELAAYFNGLLKVGEVKDSPNALNGLQVENSGEVTKIAVAVDACEAVLRRAVDAKADLLIVHHGLFWSGLGPVTGTAYRKLRLALDGNLAVYSAHLPLDAHPVFGNNALLTGRRVFCRPKQQFQRSVFCEQASPDEVGRCVGDCGVNCPPFVSVVMS